MVTKLDPIVSEFETQEQADSHDKWFRNKVQSALNDAGRRTPHDDIMARMDGVIAAAAARRKADQAE